MSISEPAKIITPWASTGSKNPIPANANNTTGAAGFDKGFPDITMTPEEAGGLPPAGQDFNGIFYQITDIIRYTQAGGQPTFDADLAAAIGGYPAGAILSSDDGMSLFRNTVDGNPTNPNLGGDGWARPDLQVMELYRRSYAEAGYNVVGTFQAGFTLVNANDVGIDLATGKGYTGPVGPVAPGTNPVGSVDWAPRTDETLRNDLKSTSGATVVGFGLDTTSKVMSDTSMTPNSQGASGNGVVDDSSSVSSAVSFSGSSVHLRKGNRYLVPSFSNPLGKPMFGAGHLVTSAPGGLEAKTTYADHYQRVTGQESLAAWFRLIYDQSVSPTRALKVVFSGDSTTAGDGVSVDYQINKLVRLCLQKKGLQTPYGIQSVNSGHSGAYTGQWDVTYATQDAAMAPDLYVVRWGINDPGYLKDGSSPPIDAGQSYPNRRDVNDFATSLRGGLAKFRALRTFQQTSILLMMPNSTYDIPNARDALWYEQLRDVYVQAARDFNCAFIDTYAIMQDSKYLADILMDNPMPTPGRGIHPNNTMNSFIAGVIADVIAPVGLGTYLSNNSVLCLGGGELTPSVSEPPASFKLAAMSMYRAAGANGWPIDGHALTFRTVDHTAIQMNFGFKNSDRGKMKIRFGRLLELEPGEPGDWSNWFDMTMMGGSSDVTPETGFELPVSGKMRVAFTGTMACFDGFISKSSPNTVPANTVIATIAVGYTPVREAAYGTATVWDGASFEQVPCVITPAGHIRIAKTTTLSVDRVYINVTYDNRP